MIHSALSPAASRGARLIGCKTTSHWPAFTARREELRLTCRAIARELSLRGKPTGKSTVTSWERRGKRPSESRLDLLAPILRVSHAALLAMFGLDFGLDPREKQSRRHQTGRRPVAADGRY